MLTVLHSEGGVAAGSRDTINSRLQRHAKRGHSPDWLINEATRLAINSGLIHGVRPSRRKCNRFTEHTVRGLLSDARSLASQKSCALGFARRSLCHAVSVREGLRPQFQGTVRPGSEVG